MKKMILITFFVTFISACITDSKLNNGKGLTITTVKKLHLVGMTKDNVLHKLGEPREKHTHKWIYYSEEAPKLWLYFDGENLVFITFSIWAKDSIKNPHIFLNEIEGNWSVIREPMTNPHAAPSTCFLEDLNSGKRVEVNAYKKTVSEFQLWKPNKQDKSIKEQLYRNVGKKFCIAGDCSSVTDPTDWEYNHCEWLEGLVRQKNRK